MRISLVTSNNKISFTLLKDRFVDALTTCNLGSGTINDPIKADGFIKINAPELYTFYAGETIQLEFTHLTNTDPEVNLVCCTFKDVGKKTETKGLVYKTDWSSIFDVEDNSIQILPNESLMIAPKKGVASIYILDATPTEKELFTYVTYSIVFMYIFDNRPYYFIIDPLLKISSRKRPRHLKQ